MPLPTQRSLTLNDQEVQLLIEAAESESRSDLIELLTKSNRTAGMTKLNLSADQSASLSLICTHFLLKVGLDQNDRTNAIGLVLEDMIDRLHFDSETAASG